VPTNELPQALIETAKTNGGSDNITVILGVVEGGALLDQVPDQIIESAPEITGADSFKDEPLEESVTEQA
jgi:serine/threonine protein phosphatase PrpC